MAVEPGTDAQRAGATHASCRRSALQARARLLAAGLFACCALWLSAVPSAQAQSGVEASEAQARRSFEAGRDAYDRGRFEQALRHFEYAYALSHHPELLFNIARAAEAEDRRERAVEAYESYLRALPQADNREFVEARLERLRAPVAAREPAREARHETVAGVPSASQTAALSLQQASPSALPRDASEPPPRSVWKRAWLWSVLGVAAAGAVTAALLLSRPGEPQRAAADEHIAALGARQ
jgi:tetratricopeptide (TPR) repeat protein